MACAYNYATWPTHSVTLGPALSEAPQALTLAAIRSKLQALAGYILGITNHPEIMKATVPSLRTGTDRQTHLLRYLHIILGYSEDKLRQK